MHVQMSIMLCEKVPRAVKQVTQPNLLQMLRGLGFIQAAPPYATSQSAVFADQAAGATRCCRLTIETLDYLKQLWAKWRASSS